MEAKMCVYNKITGRFDILTRPPNLKNNLNLIHSIAIKTKSAPSILKRKMTDYFNKMPAEQNITTRTNITSHEITVNTTETYLTNDSGLPCLNKEQKKNKLSVINSNTAKNGYTEEELVCVDLNTNVEIQQFCQKLIPLEYDTCIRFKGNSKIDISSENKELTAQVKKYKNGQFQQLDRHWVDNLIKHIPGLEKIQFMMKGLCEYKLLENGTHVDKTVSIKKLCHSNYDYVTLHEFTTILNLNRKKILEYAFYGTNEGCRPKYLIGVEYANNVRTKIVFFKINDIITYLDTQTFWIKDSKSVIALGNNDAITLQRKGGDNGLKSANQLQIKIIISSLFNNVEHIAYSL